MHLIKVLLPSTSFLPGAHIAHRAAVEMFERQGLDGNLLCSLDILSKNKQHASLETRLLSSKS